jgi:hypothetical protein
LINHRQEEQRRHEVLIDETLVEEQPGRDQARLVDSMLGATKSFDGSNQQK